MTDYFEVTRAGRSLRGLLHLGENDIPVVIVHGYFSSNKIGPHRFYFQMAEALNHLGYTVLRIDLSGMGESDGTIDNIEFVDHVLDTNAAVNEVIKRAKQSRVHYIGHCVGCCNVIKNVNDYQDTVASVTLVSPFMPSEMSFIRMLGERNYREVYHSGVTCRKGLLCRKSFIDAGFLVEDSAMLETCLKHNLFVYVSADDELVDVASSINWTTSHRIPYSIISGADHNYLDRNARNALFHEICTRFASFKSSNNFLGA